MQTSLPMENILESCVRGMLEQGKTVEECLERYSAQREELEPLLRLSERLQAARSVQAPPEFRQAAALRMHNLIAAHPRQPARPVVKPNPARAILASLQTLAGRVQPRLAYTVLAGVLLVVFLFTGSNVVSAANRSLPGEPLYPVKSAIETAQLAVSLNEAGDGQLHLAFAKRRLVEAALLLEDRPEDVGGVLEKYSLELEITLNLVDKDETLTPEQRVVLAGELVEELPALEARLDALLRRSPAGIQERVEQALDRTRAGLRRAEQVFGPLPGLPETLPVYPLHTPTPVPSGTPLPAAAGEATPTPTPTPLPSATNGPKTESVPWKTLVPAEFATEWVPKDWAELWPTYWPTPRIPREWPPTQWPPELPTEWPRDWPTAWPTGWPDDWPTDLPDDWPTQWPDDWPDELPTGLPPELPEVTPPAPPEIPDLGDLKTPRPTPESWPLPPGDW